MSSSSTVPSQPPDTAKEAKDALERIIQTVYYHTVRNKFDNMVLYSIQNNERLINTVKTETSATAATAGTAGTAPSTGAATAATTAPNAAAATAAATAAAGATPAAATAAATAATAATAAAATAATPPENDDEKLLRNLGIHCNLFHNLEGYDITQQFNDKDNANTFMMSLQSFVMKNNVAGIYDMFKSYQNKSHTFNTNTYDTKAVEVNGQLNNDFNSGNNSGNNINQKDLGIINQYIKENFSKIFKKIRIVSKYGVCKRHNGSKLTLTICNTVNPSEKYVYDIPNSSGMSDEDKKMFKFRTPTSVVIDNTNDIYLKYWVSVRMELIRREQYTLERHTALMQLIDTPYQGINGFMIQIDQMVKKINEELKIAENTDFNKRELVNDENNFKKPTEFIVQNITNIQLNDALYILSQFDDVLFGVSQPDGITTEPKDFNNALIKLIGLANTNSIDTSDKGIYMKLISDYYSFDPIKTIIDEVVTEMNEIYNDKGLQKIISVSNNSISHEDALYILDAVYHYLRHMDKTTEMKCIILINNTRSDNGKYHTDHHVSLPSMEFYNQIKDLHQDGNLQTILNDYNQKVSSQFGKFNMIGTPFKKYIYMNEDSRTAGILNEEQKTKKAAVAKADADAAADAEATAKAKAETAAKADADAKAKKAAEEAAKKNSLSTRITDAMSSVIPFGNHKSKPNGPPNTNGGHLDMSKIVNTVANKIDRMNDNKQKRRKTLHLKPKRTRRNHHFHKH